LFFNAAYSGSGRYGGGRTYDVTQDGRRFLMLKQEPGAHAPAPSVVVVLNWFEELKRAVPRAQ
jgi:hypothetical protein